MACMPKLRAGAIVVYARALVPQVQITIDGEQE